MSQLLARKKNLNWHTPILDILATKNLFLLLGICEVRETLRMRVQSAAPLVVRCIYASGMREQHDPIRNFVSFRSSLFIFKNLFFFRKSESVKVFFYQA